MKNGLKNVTFIPVWVLMVWVLGAFALSTVSAETEPELKGEALHIALVETALKYDFQSTLPGRECVAKRS